MTRMHKSHFANRLFAGFFMLALTPPALSQVESIRDSQYEWQCETQAGMVISGHTRQDKAFQSCINHALADGQVYIVRGGTYRIKAENGSPPEPPPDPEPEPPDPPQEHGDVPLVTLGPVSEATEYPPDISAFQQDEFRWVIDFTINQFHDKQPGEPRSATVQGLVSRDESGQNEKGHISVWTEDIATGDHRVRVRHQDIRNGSPSIQLQSSSSLKAGQEHEVVLSVSVAGGISLFLDGVLEASATHAFGLAGNNLPLALGAMRSRYNQHSTPPVGLGSEISGTVKLEIWDDPLPPPEPNSASLMWSNPTQRVDGTPLSSGEIGRTEVLLAGERIAIVEGDVSGYEFVTWAQGEHCFTARTVDTDGRRSDDSNRACITF